MIRTYNALTGMEVATAIAKKATQLALSIPGMNSRLVTFPRVRITISVKVEAFEREPHEVTDMDELVEKLVAEGVEQAYEGETGRFEVVIDENDNPPDKIREDAGIQVTRPQLREGSTQIVDVPAEPNPLPAGENLANIEQFGKPGGATLADGSEYSGRGRVINQETVGLAGASPINPKLKGDPNASHFRVRKP